jgi:pimeloyl-ACP methyl ester carboxylesterase
MKMRLMTTILLAMLLAASAALAGEGFVVTADSVRIHYTDQGAGEPALVFVHGWSCDGTYWGAQVPEFAKTHRVVTVDLAGHGASSANRVTFTMDLFGEDVVTVLKALDLKGVILVGHSMGGAVIVEAALLAPDRVAGLVGVENFQNINLSLPGSAIVNFMSPFRANFHDSVEEWVSGMFAGGPGTELARAVSADMASAPEEVALSSMAEMMSWYGSAPIKRMKKLTVPLMSINVDIPATDVEAIKGIIPAYQCRVMEKHGHFLMREDPEGFNKLLAETLSAMGDLDKARK